MTDAQELYGIFSFGEFMLGGSMTAGLGHLRAWGDVRQQL